MFAVNPILISSTKKSLNPFCAVLKVRKMYKKEIED